jgi:hypothetical protein
VNLSYSTARRKLHSMLSPVWRQKFILYCLSVSSWSVNNLHYSMSQLTLCSRVCLCSVPLLNFVCLMAINAASDHFKTLTILISVFSRSLPFVKQTSHSLPILTREFSNRISRT